jgi:predicted RNA-binding protein with PUA-like domain
MQYWLIKSEPDVYSWHDLVRDGQTFWDGVRNYQARNNLRAMASGDFAVFYHSTTDKEAVGIVRIVRTAYQDPTTDNVAWVAVDVSPHAVFQSPVSLDTIKHTPELSSIALLKQPRLSVVPLTAEEFAILCRLGGISTP